MVLYDEGMYPSGSSAGQTEAIVQYGHHKQSSGSRKVLAAELEKKVRDLHIPML